VSLRPFQRPFAIAEGCILVRVIRALHDIAATRHVILAVSRAVQLVGIIAAIVLFVALECRVDTPAVRAVERTCGVIIVIIKCPNVKQRDVTRGCGSLCATNLPDGQALARHMKGRSDSHVVSSHVCRSSVRATSTHSPECGFGCRGAQKPVDNNV